jgi:hypothetical protein
VVQQRREIPTLRDGGKPLAPTRRHAAPHRLTHLSSTVVGGDVDGDGDVDLVLGGSASCIPCPGAQTLLYLNDGSGRFTDATATRMPVTTAVSPALALGDVDRDLDLDLVLGNTRSQWNGSAYVAGQDFLYLNDGSGRFRDATATHLPFDNNDTAAVALADVDGDRDLDLVVGIGAHASSTPPPRNALCRNDGTGRFADVSATHLPARAVATRAIAVRDLDRDGDVDLIVGTANLGGANEWPRVYVNDGTGRFCDAPAGQTPLGADCTLVASALACEDFDRDTDLDVLIGSFDQRSRLLNNDGSGRLTDNDMPRMPNLACGNGVSSSLALGDLDRDGDVDEVAGLRTAFPLLGVDPQTAVLLGPVFLGPPTGQTTSRSRSRTRRACRG